MQAEVRGIALSLIDFLGVLLPGLVWLIQLIAFGRILDGHSENPWLVVKAFLLAGQMAPLLWGFAILCASLIVGYLVKANAMHLSELLARPESWRRRGNDRRFPYRKTHEKRKYYEAICEYLQFTFPEDWQQMAGHPPFTLCKRIIKALDPFVWEECEYREAELRLIASLFLASVASTLFSIVGLIAKASYALSWLTASLVALLLLLQIFRRMRSREVDYIYLLFYVAIRYGPGAPTSSVSGPRLAYLARKARARLLHFHSVSD